MAIFPEKEKDCVKDRYLHSKAKIRVVQHCAAILAILELLFLFDKLMNAVIF